MNIRASYTLVILVVLSILATLVTSSSSSSGVGYQDDFPHARVLVVEVLDDLTLRITPPVKVQGVYREFVKLADISPRTGAVQKLDELLSVSARIVYLDLDSRTVENDSAVATVYVRINESHILNVNKWLVVNGYAEVLDKSNIFDPSKWIMHFIYPIESENLPPITRTVLCNDCPVSNATTWGVNVRTTPERAYFAVAYTLDETPQRVRIAVIDSDGQVIRHEVIDGTNVALGYIDLASNETGFFITWRDLTIGPNRARCAFIPVNPALPVNVSDRVFGGGGSWHSLPIAAWNPFNESWIVVYVHQTMAWRPRYFINFVNKMGLPAGGTGAIWLSPPSGMNRTGVDIQGRLIYDPVSKNFAFLSRNETAPGEFDIELIVFPADKPTPLSEVVDVIRLYIDNRPGPQGPEPSMFNTTFSYFNLYPSIHSALLGTGRYLLVVYNDTSSSLAYSVVDLSEKAVLVRETLTSLDANMTFYPWISSGKLWVVVWSADGTINVSTVQPNAPFVLETFTLSKIRSGALRAIYDPASSLHALSYTITLPSNEHGLYMVFLRDEEGRLESWILPIKVANSSIVPLHMVALETNSTAGNLGVIVLENDDLVLYIVNNTYPLSLQPAKNASPVYTPTPTPTPQPVTLTETITITVTRTVTTTFTTTATTTYTTIQTTTVVETRVDEKVIEETITVTEKVESTITETITRRETTTVRETLTEVKTDTKTVTRATTVIPPEAEYANVVLAIGVLSLVSAATILFFMRRRGK